MKTLIFLLLGVVIGLGGATAYIAPKEKARLVEAAAVAESVAAADADVGELDPADAGEQSEDLVDEPPAADDRAPGEEDQDPPPAAPVEEAPPEADVAPEADAPQAAPPPVAPEPAVAAAGGSPLNPSEGARKLGKVFGAMRPEEAARVLSLLDDDDVVEILMSLKERPAASILANLEADRAARLTMIVMGPGS